MIQITLVGPKPISKVLGCARNGRQLFGRIFISYLCGKTFLIYANRTLFGYEVRRDKREKHLLGEYIAVIQ